MANPYTRFGADNTQYEDSQDPLKSYGSKSTGKTKRRNPYTRFGYDQNDDPIDYSGASDQNKPATTTAPAGKSNASKLGDIIKGIGEGISSSYKRIGKGVGESWSQGATNKAAEEQNKLVEQNVKIMSDYTKKLKDPALDPKRKASIEKAMGELRKQNDEIYKQSDQRQKEIMDATDPVKGVAAVGSIGFDVLTAGTYGASTKGASTGVRLTAKQIAKNTVEAGIKKTLIKEALIQGGQGAVAGGLNAVQEKGTAVTAGDIAKQAAVGGALAGALPVVPKAVKRAGAGIDTATSKAATNIIQKTGKSTHALEQIGEKGILGAANKGVSDATRTVTYKLSDMLGSTKPGNKLIGLKDNFMSHWVTDLHPLYKVLKRSDFEGKTNGAYIAAREAIGNSNRALSYAQDFLETNPNIKAVTTGIEEKGGKNLLKARESFDEYAKVRSELDLIKGNQKEFSAEKVADLESRMAKAKDFSQEYDHLVAAYKDVNDFRLENGLMSKEQYQDFLDNPIDYVRQQRELPQWMLDKPGAKESKGSAASITKSNAVQKRNKFADAELLSPVETMVKTVQNAHVEAYRNKAAKEIYALLDEAGEAKLIRSTEKVREKQDLLKTLSATKPAVKKLEKILRTDRKQVRKLMTEMDRLNKEGLAVRLNRNASDDLPEAFRYVNTTEVKNPKRTSEPTMSSVSAPKNITGTATDRLAIEGGVNPKKMMEALVSEDPARIKMIRQMIESRDDKLVPLLDKIEIIARDLDDIHSTRSSYWNEANGIKTDVNKKNITSLSFLDDGVENVVSVDPVIASAVQNWDKQSQNVMNNFLRTTNNVFKYGTTGANVAFALPNFVADQASSAINSKSVMSTHNPINFIHSLFMTAGKPLPGEDAEILRAYMAGNKRALSINQYTKPAKSATVTTDLLKENASRGAKAFTTLRNPKEWFRELFNSTESLIGATENLTRIQNFRGTYKKAGKKGLDATKLANTAARENSVDFLEMGSYGRVVNSLIPYFNASIQGSRTLARNASERPVSFAAKTAAIVGMPVAMTTAWNTSDPDRKAIYDTIPPYVKEGNFVVVSPGAKWNEGKKKWDGVYLMKKPQGYKEFAEPVRKFIEYKAGKGDSLGDFLKEQGGDIATDFGAKVGPIDFSSENAFLSSVTPQALKPTAEAILNKDFFTGRDIVSPTLGKNAPQDQKYEEYSQLTSWIAGQFNTSPLKVDKWIKATFGEAGTNIQNSADYIINKSGVKAPGDNPNANIGGRSLPESISRRFSGAPGGEDTTAFYKSYTPAVNQRAVVSKKVTELIKQGKRNEAARRAEEYNATIENRFQDFFSQYKGSPTYDPSWDEDISSLHIPITKASFNARAKQK